MLSPLTPLRDSVLLGIVAGMRSMMAPAFLSRRLNRNGAGNSTHKLDRLLAHPLTGVFTGLTVAGELVGDKLPGVPDRVDPAPFAGRVIIGAIAGGMLARNRGADALFGAAAGFAGAAVSTAGFYLVRRALTSRLHIPDFPVAIAEDILAISLAGKSTK